MMYRTEISIYKLTLYVPESHLETVKKALFKAGAGRYKNYDRCCWQIEGHGQFRPLKGSDPFLGSEQVEEHLPEYRVEMICEEQLIGDVAAALKNCHPYEEPAFDFIKIETG